MQKVFNGKDAATCDKLGGFNGQGCKGGNGQSVAKFAEFIEKQRQKDAQGSKHGNVEDDVANFYYGQMRWGSHGAAIGCYGV